MLNSRASGLIMHNNSKGRDGLFILIFLIMFYLVDGILYNDWNCILKVNYLLVSRLMSLGQITLCGQWELTSVISMLIHGSDRWTSLSTMSIWYSLFTTYA